MKKLDKYIIKKFIGTFLFTLLIVIGIVIIFDLSEKIDKFVDNQVPVKEIILDYYMGFIPWIINSFSPLFVFISAIFFTSKLAGHSEIIAILAGGISFKRFLKPYLISAGAIALFSLVMSLFIVPPANEARLNFESKYIKSQNANDSRNIHYQIAPGQFVYIEQFSQWANTAYRFSLETIEDNQVVSKLEAESATWDSTLCGWKLNNYFIRDFYGDSENVRSGSHIDTVISLTIEDFYLRKNAAESLSWGNLNDFIATQKMRGDANVKRALIEKNNRIAMPFSAFILTIMAVSLCSKRKRGGLGLNIGIGLALSFSYILFMRFSQMFVYTGTLDPALALWIPNILYAIITAFLYKMAPK